MPTRCFVPSTMMLLSKKSYVPCLLDPSVELRTCGIPEEEWHADARGVLL